MSSTAFVTPIDLELRPSRRLAWFFGVAHACIFPVVWLLDLPGWMRAVLTLMVLASGLRVARQFGAATGGSTLIRLQWRAGESWLLFLAGGELLEARLLPCSYVHRHLVLLNFRCLDRRRNFSCVITRDRMTPDTFRRLRVLLRWHIGKKPG